MKQDIEFINFGKMIARKEKQVKELTWFIYLKSYITVRINTTFNMKKRITAVEKSHSINFLLQPALQFIYAL